MKKHVEMAAIDYQFFFYLPNQDVPMGSGGKGGIFLLEFAW